MTFERSAATTRPMSAGSPQPPAFPRSIFPFTARLRSPWFARWSTLPWPSGCSSCTLCGCNMSLFSNANPMMAPVATLAEQVRRDRKPVEADNPFVALQENVSRQIVAGLDAWRDMTEALAERTFLTIYGLPIAAGCRRHRPCRDAPAAEGSQEPATSRTPSEADCRAQVAHPSWWAARSRHPRTSVCGHDAGGN